MPKRYSQGLIAANKNTLNPINVYSTDLGMANLAYQFVNSSNWPVPVDTSSTLIGLATNVTPFITVYSWSSAGGFGSKYNDPTSLPGGAGQGITIGGNGTPIVLSNTTSPYLAAYSFNKNSGFGTRYGYPAAAAGTNGTGAVFSQSYPVKTDRKSVV